MQKRKLGNSNLEVSALGLGCMRMTFGDAPIGTRQEMIDFLHMAVDRGITFFDTAEVYGPFTNEDLVGPRRQQHHRCCHRRGLLPWAGFCAVRYPHPCYSRCVAGAGGRRDASN